MAELQITLEDLENYIDNCLSSCHLKYDKKFYKISIMSALTMDDSSNAITQQEHAKNAADLWYNKIETNSKLLCGKKYIKIKDTILAFIRATLISGFIDGIILSSINPTNIAIPIVAATSNAALEIHKVIKDSYCLEDNNFCVYFQAVAHHKKHKKFTVEDVKSWFPNDINCKCNITQEKWDCEFISAGKCEYLSKADILNTLEALCDKKILNKTVKKDKVFYQFAR